MKQDYRNITPFVDNSKNTVRYAHDYKKTYLFLYDLCMFIMFLKILIILMIKGTSKSMDDDTVTAAVFLMKLLNLVQFSETIPIMMGLIQSNKTGRSGQIFTRMAICFLLSDETIRQHSNAGGYYLIMIWCIMDVIRYSYYTLKVFKVHVYSLTWCRYTVTLPLYPIVGILESKVLYSSIDYFEDVDNNLSSLISSCMKPSGLLRIYCYIVLCPSIYKPMLSIWKKRSIKLKDKSHCVK